MEIVGVNHLSIQQAGRLVSNVRSFYNAMLRNGWYLPHLKSSLVNQDYLEKVKAGKVWCPKYSDIRLSPCPDPPPKSLLLDLLDRAF